MANPILKEADNIRLAEVLKIVENLKLRYPVAEISRKTGENPGNTSNYLKGKKPMSDNFYTTFMEKVALKKVLSTHKIADAGKEISRLVELTISQQASINVLTKTVEELSAKSSKRSVSLISGEMQQAAKLEADRLRNEYLKK